MDTNWGNKYLQPQFNQGGMASGAPSTMQKSMGMGIGAGMLGSGLAGLFGGGGSNPYDAANDYYKQIPDNMRKYLDPYIKSGQNAMGQLQGQYGQLTNDPGAMYNKLGAGYHESPGYQWQLGQGMNAAGNAAAAGGMAGTPEHQQRAMTMAQGLANQDFGNYMGNVSNLYGRGLQGLEGMNQMGYGASSDMATSLANYLAMQGQGAFAGQAAENQSQGDMWGNLFGGIGTLAGLFGGGGTGALAGLFN